MDYHEAPLSFIPTYKYRNGTNIFDTKRAPAWCDRVLWRTAGPAYAMEAKAYSSCELLQSDHRPVFALLSADVKLAAGATGGNQAAVAGVRQAAEELARFQPGTLFRFTVGLFPTLHPYGAVDARQLCLVDTLRCLGVPTLWMVAGGH